MQYYSNKTYDGRSLLGFIIDVIRRGSEHRVYTIWLTNILLFTLLASFSLGQEAPLDLTELSLEDLMNIEVTSVSKKAEKLSRAAAAIYVITGEDIHRSGVTSIPEALRMVPGVQVAHIDANIWAITSRGFNDRYSNKLLVLIDGRTIYSPLYSGVFWDTQDIMLDNIERIEVIRGPGATLWGANAVNGVINIITKNSKNSQGIFVNAGFGSEEQGFGSIRYGGKLGKEACYRVYTKYFNRDNFVDSAGNEAADMWDVLSAGFRIDWNTSGSNKLTLQGDVYDGNIGKTGVTTTLLVPPYTQVSDAESQIYGGNVLARWNKTLSVNSDMMLQFYYDRTTRIGTVGEQTINTLDFDFNYHFLLSRRQEIVWGLGYRAIMDNLQSSFTMSFGQDSRSDHKVSAFIQDEIILVKKQFRLILGSKFENNNYTGWEIQPNARLVWNPNDRQTIWTAVSRAVRTPSRLEMDFRANFLAFPGPGGLTLLSLFGNRDVKSEELLAYELGYRIRPMDQLFFDMTTFYNDYDNLITWEAGQPFPENDPAPPHLVIPLRLDNKMSGKTYGLEITSNSKIMDFWQVNTGFTWLKIDLIPDASSNDTISEATEGNSPQYQLNFCSYMDLPHNFRFNAGAYFVDDLTNLGIDSYIRLDTKLCWHPIPAFEISVTAQNLLDDIHPEFNLKTKKGLLTTQVQRSVYGQATWRF